MTTATDSRSPAAGPPGFDISSPMSGVPFDYDLPTRLIAQYPCAERDRSRLLLMTRATGALAHHQFRDLPELLTPGDLLVLNDTRVLSARLIGRRVSTGGRWEGLFHGQTADGLWELLSQTRGRPRPGERVELEPGPLRLELIGRSEAGGWLARPDAPGSAADLLGRHGHVPLPPYIRKGRADADDTERYQTVFACRPGSVAAPTAGLHFTPELLECLGERGIGHTHVTLHVGIGTFRPMKADDPTQHVMHREWCAVPPEAVVAIGACRGRVIAVGTTVVRTLETAAAGGELRPWEGETGLFVRPPFPFRVVGGLVTNFHLPRTTLLLLAAAFAGPDLLRRAYETAVANEYRFYSYGDAMLIL